MNDRYARVEQVEMIGADGVARLQASTAAVVGVGNLGGAAATHLAMLGLGLLLVDRDVVGEENLGTQGFIEADVGLPKVEARAGALLRMNSACRISTLHADVESLGLGALRRADIIFCCLDSLRGRATVNEVATRLGIPWVDAAVDGSGKSLLGRVAAYDPRSPKSPCFMCPHDSQSLAEIMREGVGGRCPVWRWSGSVPAATPTAAISALGAAVAAAQVVWGLRVLLGKAPELVGCEAYLDLGRTLLESHLLVRNPSCIFDHQPFTLVPAGAPVGTLTVRDLFEKAERALGEDAELHLHRRSLVTEVRCPECGAQASPNKTLDAMSPGEASCRCGTSMQPVAGGLLDRLRRAQAHEFLDNTWEQLGLPPDDVVTAAADRREIHYLLQ